jgi:O-antigen/teichoic acid export membrane protein
MSFFRTALIGSALTFSALPLAYLVRLLYIRGLTIEEYGLFYAIISLFSLAALIVTLGLNPALGHLIPKHGTSRTANRLITASSSIQFILLLFMSVLIFSFAPLLESIYFKTDGAAIALRILTGYFIAHQVAAAVSGIFLGYRVVFAYAGYELYRQMGVLIASATAALLFGLNLVTVAIAWTVSHAALSIGYVIALKMRTPHVAIEKPLHTNYRELFSYAIPTLFVGGAAIIMAQIDTVMITALRTIEEVAAYNVAYPTAHLLLILASPIAMAILPEISKLHHDNRREDAQALIQTTFRVIASMIVLGTVILSVLAEPILTVLFGSVGSQAWPALTVLSFGLAASGLATVNLQVLGAIGRVGRRAIIMNTVVILNIVLNLILIAWIGYLGAAIATSVSYLSLLFLAARELRREGFATLTFDLVWRVVLAAVLSAVVIAAMSNIVVGLIQTIIIGAVSGALVFLAVAIMTKLVDPKDLQGVIKQIWSPSPKKSA